MRRSFSIHQRTSSSSTTTSWRKLQRSNSLLLASEFTADSEDAKIGAYQRLSPSTLVSNDSGGFFCINLEKGRANYWTEKIGKLFSLRGIRGRGQVAEPGNKLPEGEVAAAAAQVVKKQKRSSWLPDPERRWPVQGW